MGENQGSAARSRLDNLDLLKAVGILMVLTIHVPLWELDFIAVPSMARAAQYALRLVSEGVPLFVMVNGLLLFGKDGFDLKKHLYKTARMFGLLLVWAVILAVAGMVLDRNGEHITPRSVLAYLLAVQVGEKYTGVLWFMQNLLAVYLIFPALRWLYRERFDLFKYLFAVVFAFTVGIDTLELVRDYAAAFRGVALLDALIGFAGRFSPVGNGWYLFYFMLGGMLHAWGEWVRRHRVALAVLGICSWPWAFAYGYTLSWRLGSVYDPTFNYGSAFMLLFAVGLYALALPYRSPGGPLGRLVSSVGGNTFGIYVSHFLFIFAANRFFTIDRAWERAAAYAIVFLLSWLFSLAVGRLPVLRRLVRP